MSYVEDIRKISGHEMVFALLFLSGAICPGIATLWFFEPTLPKELGVVMVTLLAVSITLPIISLNVLTMLFTFELSSNPVGAFFLNTKNKSAYAAILLVTLGASIAMFVLGIPLLAAFSLSLSRYQFSCIAGSLQTVFLLLELICFQKLGAEITKDTLKVEKVV